jgi:protein tyrosine kinase modulator
MSDALSIQPPDDLVEPTVSLAEYVSGFKRRRNPIIYTAAVVIFLALLTALFWPPTYKASATILIEEQEIPDDMVRTTITSFANQQIEVIRQRVLTLKNIMGMVENFELYDEDELARTPRTEISEDFIDAVKLEILSAEVIDPRSGRPTVATVAFTLDFEASDPRKTQGVANELVNLFLNENLRSRSEQAGSTTDFIRAQAEGLAEEVRNLEVTLVAFKAKNQAALPESFQLNMQNLTRYQTQLVSSEARLIELNRRQLEVEGQLASMNKYAPQTLPSGESVLADVDRLKSLESEYSRQSARYNENHPDVIRLRREIDALRVTVGGTGATDELRRVMATEQDELTGLQANYSDTHPEVIAQIKAIEKLREQIATANEAEPEIKPDNPGYVVMDNQLQMIMMEKRSLTDQIASVTAQIEGLNQAATQAPTVEREYSTLVRNLEVATANYLELQAKLKTAELAGELESNRKGQRFTLIEPPILPENPVSPNRAAILFLGIVFSLAAGLGVGLLLETADQSIRSVRSLEKVTGIPPLVSVAYITTPEEDRKNEPNKKRYIYIGITAVAVIMGLVLIHFFYKPLDVLWYVVLNKLGIG